MKFSEVLPALEAGRRVRRTFWASVNGWIVFDSSGIRDERGEECPQAMALENVRADDWEVIPEEPAKAAPCSSCACYHDVVARLTRELEEALADLKLATTCFSTTNTPLGPIRCERPRGDEHGVWHVNGTRQWGDVDDEGEWMGRRSEAGAPKGGTDRG